MRNQANERLKRFKGDIFLKFNSVSATGETTCGYNGGLKWSLAPLRALVNLSSKPSAAGRPGRSSEIWWRLLAAVVAVVP